MMTYIDHTLLPLRHDVLHILIEAKKDPHTFIILSKENKTIVTHISFKTLLIWLQTASNNIKEITGENIWGIDQQTNAFGTITSQINYTEDQILRDIEVALNVVKKAFTYSGDMQPKKSSLPLVSLSSHVYEKGEQPEKRIKGTRKRTTKRININGVSAGTIETKTKANLVDPIFDVELILNNPIGRLWLALKRMWKSQHTDISIKLSIPLFVLPVMLFIGYRIWSGQYRDVPLIVTGTIHQTVISGNTEYLIKFPNASLYILKPINDLTFPEDGSEIIAVGMFHQPTSTLKVESLGLFNEKTKTELKQSNDLGYFQEILQFLTQFY